MNIYKYLKRLRLEEKAVAINWLLFILSWLIYFGLITGSTLTITIFILTPAIGIGLTYLIRYIREALIKNGIIAKPDPKNQSDTSIDVENDDQTSAISKFCLHVFINTYVLVVTMRILSTAYGLSAAGLIGYGFITVIILIMVPIVIKEIISLANVCRKNHQHHDHKINYGILVVSFLASCIVAAGVFMLLEYLTELSITLLPMAYSSMLFITPLVTLEFLFLVTYLIYMYWDHGDIELNHSKIINNVLAFIGITFSLLFGVYKLSCLIGAFDITAILTMSTFPAIGMAILPFILPIIGIFVLATLAFLIHKDNIEARPGDSIDTQPLKPASSKDIGINTVITNEKNKENDNEQQNKMGKNKCLI